MTRVCCGGRARRGPLGVSQGTEHEPGSEEQARSVAYGFMPRSTLPGRVLTVLSPVAEGAEPRAYYRARWSAIASKAMMRTFGRGIMRVCNLAINFRRGEMVLAAGIVFVAVLGCVHRPFPGLTSEAYRPINPFVSAKPCEKGALEERKSAGSQGGSCRVAGSASMHHAPRRD